MLCETILKSEWVRHNLWIICEQKSAAIPVGPKSDIENIPENSPGWRINVIVIVYNIVFSWCEMRSKSLKNSNINTRQ